jgi:cadmium resistance transport/sequestration family protein
MPHVLLTAFTAAVAFITTNVDDILLLMLFFAQVNLSFRKRHVVSGQYLGFIIVLGISLLGFAGTLILPQNLVGLLGLIPIVIGVYQLVRKHDDDDDDVPDLSVAQSEGSVLAGLLSAHTFRVAGVTLANSADNVSVYVPLFASHNPTDVALIIAIFLVLVGVWCYAGYRLVRYPAIARFLERYGERLMPYVFILLGLYILLESALSF